jgi:hypothetical protein
MDIKKNGHASGSPGPTSRFRPLPGGYPRLMKDDSAPSSADLSGRMRRSMTGAATNGGWSWPGGTPGTAADCCEGGGRG